MNHYPKGDTIARDLFIVRDTSSFLYKMINDFPADEKFNLLDDTSGGYLRRLKKNDMLGLPQNWVVMVSYKGKYYPYLNERLIGERLQINDTTRITYWMDGNVASPIISVKKKSKIHYEVNTWQNDKGVLNIYLVDDKHKIAVFEENSIQSLMISADHVRDFPIIACYNEMNRVDIRPDAKYFDKIDTKKLIREAEEREKKKKH